MENLKLFISQPIHGIDNSKIINQSRALRTVVECCINYHSSTPVKVELIDMPINVKYPPEVKEYFPTEDSLNIFKLGNSIHRMANADIIVFYGDWKHDRDCMIQLEVAKRYGIKFIGQNRLFEFCESDPKFNDELELLWPNKFDKLHEVVSSLKWESDDEEK